MMMPRDKDIASYIEQYGCASTKQIEKIFFRNQHYSYNLARRRLNELVKLDYLKVVTDEVNRKNIYVYKQGKMKMPSQHRLLILDVLAELHYMGASVEHFEVERHWIDEKNKGAYSDGFAIFTIDTGKEIIRYHYFIEVQLSNNLHNLSKYDALHDTGLVQQFYIDNSFGKNFYPKRILLLSDREYKQEIKIEHCQVIQVDTNLNNFYKILF